MPDSARNFQAIGRYDGMVPSDPPEFPRLTPSEPTPPLQPKWQGVIPPMEPRSLAAAGDAAYAWKPIARAILIGTIEAWSLLIFGILSMMCGLSTPSGLLVGGGLIVLGVIELKALARIKRLDPSALPQLVWMELALIGLISVYFGYQVYASLEGNGSEIIQAINDPNVRQVLGDDFIQQAREMTALIYGILILAIGVSQGLMALMYHRRKRMMADYLRKTPDWILALQKNGMRP